MDAYADTRGTETSPSRNPFAVVPDDNADLPVIPKAIYVGTGGDIVLMGIESSADVTFKNVPSGYILDVRPRRIYSTGTTAADIVALA